MDNSINSKMHKSRRQSLYVRNKSQVLNKRTVNDWNNNVLNRFIRQCIYEQLKVNVYLNNQSILSGLIKDFDKNSLILKTDDKKYLIFFNSIISIIQDITTFNMNKTFTNTNIKDNSIKQLYFQNDNEILA